MAKAKNLETQKTIRDFLSETLGDYVVQLQDEQTVLYNVDLLWNGQEYLIAYTDSPDDDNQPITINLLTNILPIKLVTPTTTP